MMEAVLNQIESRVPIVAAAGDYVQDGLVYCGQCHTARQVRVYIPWKDETQVRACMCKCQKEQAEQKQAVFAAEQEFRRIQQLLPQGMPETFLQRCNFSADDGADSRSMTVLRRYVQKFAKMQAQNTGLLLWGQPGTGKTFGAGCVANALLDEQYTVLIRNVAQLLQELSNYKTNSQQYVRQLCCYDLLILDELTLVRQNTAQQELLYQVIEARSKAERPVLITTNLGPDELAQGDAGWQRIFDRLQAMCVPLQFSGESRRQQIHQQKLAFARQELLG